MPFSLLHKLLLRLNGGRLIAHFNVTTTREINRRRVVLPLMGGVGLDNLTAFEPWLETWLDRLFRRRAGAFVDVGVNVGQTLLKAKALAPDIAYVGFEPNPVCFHYARRLIEVNRFENCTLVPIGLSNRAAVLPFFARSEVDASGSVVEDFRPRRESPQMMYVPVFDGDSVLEKLEVSGVAVLKIDVEGGELEVVEGLRRTIQRDRPFVICEILPLFSESDPKRRFRRPRQDRLIAQMRDAGYVLFRVLGNATTQALTDVEPHDDMRLTNYLFAPAEDAEFVGDEREVPSED